MMADGHLGKCKACTKRDVKNNRAVKADYYSGYESARSKTGERKQQMRSAALVMRSRNPEKYKARTELNNAVRDGRIKRQPCSVYGCTRVAQAHHDDHSKPLEVKWLCFVHHREKEHHQTVVRKN